MGGGREGEYEEFRLVKIWKERRNRSLEEICKKGDEGEIFEKLESS